MESFYNDTIDSSFFTIKNMNYDNACFYKSFVNCISNNYNIELEMAKMIQKISYEWVINNKNKYNDDFNMCIKDIVEMCHEISIEQYIKIYKYYAEDIIDNIDIERWGSIVEQIALSEIFKIPIYIYTPQKYNIKNNKINIGKINNNTPHKGVRFRLCHQIGLKYNEKEPICLLWKDGKYGPHYMSLFLNKEYKLNNKGIPYKII